MVKNTEKQIIEIKGHNIERNVVNTTLLNKEHNLIEVMKKSGCNRNVAMKALDEANNHLGTAIDLAKSYYRGTLPTLTEYSNGLEIKFNDKDIFYENTTLQGKKLLNMLNNGMFDKNVLGVNENFIDVIYVDLKTEKKIVLKTAHDKVLDPLYNSSCDRNNQNTSELELLKTYEGILPSLLQFDENYDMQFKICYMESITTCKINSNSLLSKVFNYLESFFNKKVKLTINGVSLNATQQAKNLTRGVAVLHVQ